MDRHRFQIVLARKNKSHGAVFDQSKPLTFGIVNRVECLDSAHLLAQFLWQFFHFDRPYINDGTVSISFEIISCVHTLYPLFIFI